MECPNKTAFISGHLDISKAKFLELYKSEIDNAINNGHHFVIGNAVGCDEFAIEYLQEKNVTNNRVTIYHHESTYDKIEKNHLTISDINKFGYTNVQTGFDNFTERDAMMTKDSHYDIAHVRPDHETKILMESLGKTYSATRVSGTQKNLIRRQKTNK